MHSISIPFSNLHELQDEVARRSLHDSDRTLIQVFCAQTDKEHIENIQQFFQEYFPKSFLVGSTTDGIVEGEKLYLASKSLAVFSYFEKTELSVATCKITDMCNSFCCGETITKEIVQDNTRVVIAFGDGLNLNGEEFVKGVSSVAPDVILSGGLAGDNGRMEKTYVFDKEEIIQAGAVGVALHSENLHVFNKYSFDWTAIGKKLRVTKAIKNRVYEIDGMTAVEIYAKYLGREVANALPRIGIEFPLVFEQDGVEIGRAVLVKHNDGSLSFAGNIPEGSQVRFGIGNAEKILQSVHYHISELVQESEYEAQSIFFYSCMARRRFLQKDANSELQILKYLGNVYGFYTYGEFFHAKQNNQLLNETMTLLSLSESDTPSKKSLENLSAEKNYTVKPEYAIANLVNAVTQELEELNSSLEEKIKQNTSVIYKQVYFDKLTKLPNRLSLIKDLDQCVGKAILLVNIDDFTTINDFYGYTIGDRLIVHLAHLLERKFKDEDARVYKLPSDEFAVVIAISQDRSVEDVIEELLKLVENEKYRVDDDVIDFTVTIGAATANREKTGLVNADMTLKLAKKNRKEYMVFQEEMKLSEQYEHNISMAKMIREAIDGDRILPFFQPIYDADTLKIVKYEALVRLRMDTGEIISPFRFLGIAQKIKAYPKITEIMVKKTFQIMRETGVKCTINLDFEDIFHNTTKRMIFENIKAYGIANQLTIEMLENQQISDEEKFTSFIEEVRSYGVKIAIDDFGSGFANFEHIAKIDSDLIKIDGSLVKNIDKDPNARCIVETIVTFAQKLNQKTVAEFVHSKEVFDIVKEIGVDFVQGYYFAEPKIDLQIE